MTLKEIKAYARLMQREGIVSLKCQGLEIALSPYAIKESKPKPSKDDGALEEEKPFTDDDILFWSSPPGMEQE